MSTIIQDMLDIFQPQTNHRSIKISSNRRRFFYILTSIPFNNFLIMIKTHHSPAKKKLSADPHANPSIT